MTQKVLQQRAALFACDYNSRGYRQKCLWADRPNGAYILACIVLVSRQGQNSRLQVA